MDNPAPLILILIVFVMFFVWLLANAPRSNSQTKTSTQPKEDEKADQEPEELVFGRDAEEAVKNVIMSELVSIWKKADQMYQQGLKDLEIRNGCLIVHDKSISGNHIESVESWHRNRSILAYDYGDSSFASYIIDRGLVTPEFREALPHFRDVCRNRYYFERLNFSSETLATNKFIHDQIKAFGYGGKPKFHIPSTVLAIRLVSGETVTIDCDPSTASAKLQRIEELIGKSSELVYDGDQDLDYIELPKLEAVNE